MELVIGGSVREGSNPLLSGNCGIGETGIGFDGGGVTFTALVLANTGVVATEVVILEAAAGGAYIGR